MRPNRKNNGSRRQRPGVHPGWLLLWVPLLLIALDASPSLTSAMIRLGTVLLLGALAWGMGRGPAGPWAERLFAALLLVSWFIAFGTAFREQGAPSSLAARLAVAAGLLVGPAVLLWAWRRRSQMTRVVDLGGHAVESGALGALFRLGLLGLLVVVALVVVDRLSGIQRADLLVIGTGLVLFAACRVRGRRRTLGVQG